MGRKKKVLITVNPDLVAGKRVSTIRSMVSALDPICDLLILPISEYDFKKSTVEAYRRKAGGTFSHVGTVKPEADLWIVYSDGYWLEHAQFGFDSRMEFIDAQFKFHQEALDTQAVAKIVNSPQAEKNCLKSWLAELDADKFGLIQTFKVSTYEHAHELLGARGTLVAKPDWGGAGSGIFKIEQGQDIEKLQAELEQAKCSLNDYSFQLFATGEEKRLWFVNGQCVSGRKTYGRHTPWSPDTKEFKVVFYGDESVEGFARDHEIARKLCHEAGLLVGSIDFIGDKINEINGAGTTFTQYDGFTKIVDARKPLLDYLKSLVLE